MSAELGATRRELQELYRRLAQRDRSWSRMGDQMQIARVRRRIARLEREEKDRGA
jgi:hypothetical protein